MFLYGKPETDVAINQEISQTTNYCRRFVYV
jgi:hypothetical protein